MTSLRKYLVAGLLVWVPLVCTIVVLSFSINLIDRSLLLIPVDYRPETLIGYKIPGLGAILALILVIVTGLVVANFFGRKLVEAWEALLSRIPLVRTVYGAVKQITQSLFSDASQSFREVVLVEYPKEHTCCIFGEAEFHEHTSPQQVFRLALLHLIVHQFPTF